MANLSATQSLIKELAIKIRSLMPELEEVIEEWPDANRALKMPCLSIAPSNPSLTPCQPYIFSQGTANAENQANVKWVVGQYEWTLQLDLWARNKFERHALFEKLIQVFCAQLPVMGWSIELADYHGVIARYDTSSLRYEDGEGTAQKREWRVMLEVPAHCHAISETVENVIVETALALEPSVTFIDE